MGDVRRYAQTENRDGMGFYNSIMGDDEGGYVSYDDYTAQSARIADLKERQYELAYAIAGGEDAHGLLDSIKTDDLCDMIRRERADQAGWNDATASVSRSEALREAFVAVEDCGMSPDNDLEEAFQDGIIAAVHAIENLIDTPAPKTATTTEEAAKVMLHALNVTPIADKGAQLSVNMWLTKQAMGEME